MPSPSTESQQPTAASPAHAAEEWHARPASAVLAMLDSDGARGLADVEAQRRFARDGPNELAAEPPVPAWRRFLAQFQSVLVLLLIAATVISLSLWIVERDTATPVRRDRDRRDRDPQRDARLRSGGACRAGCRGIALDVRRRGDGRARWRAKARARPRARGGGPAARRGRRHGARRRTGDRVDRAPGGGSIAHRREPAGPQERRCAARRQRARRPDRHAVQRHDRHLRARTRRRRRDGDAHRDGTRRRDARVEDGRDDATAA